MSLKPTFDIVDLVTFYWKGWMSQQCSKIDTYWCIGTHEHKCQRAYYIKIFNNISSHGCILLMKHKFELVEIFKRFRNEVEKQTAKSIRTHWFDQWSEYLYSKFLTCLEENWILSQWTSFETPLFKKMSERRNQTLFDMIRSTVDLLVCLRYVVETTSYVLENVLSKSITKFLCEIWTWVIRCSLTLGFGVSNLYEIFTNRLTWILIW